MSLLLRAAVMHLNQRTAPPDGSGIDEGPWEHSVEDVRIAARRRVLKGGSISFGGGAIDCSVRNLSQTGAALEVESPVGLPETFVLVIEMEQTKRPCRVVWRKAKRVGVHFLDDEAES